MKTATPRIFALILGMALAGLVLTPHQASAGITELKALYTQLGGPAPVPKDFNSLATFVRTKTSQEIADAVVDLTEIKSSSGPGYAGEALKVADEPDFGTVLGQTLNANAATLPSIFNAFPGDAVKTAAAKAKYIGTSAKNAATSTGAFADWIDEFAFELTATNQEAYDAAKSATASTTAVGLIVASRTKDPTIDTDAERFDLARIALLPKNTTTGGQGLTKSAQSIANYVGAATDDPADFAHDLVATSVTIGTKTSQPLLNSMPLIATGTATSNPQDASGIVNAMFDGVTANLTVPKANLSTVFLAGVKNSSKLASNVSFVADAEQVQGIAVTLGQRVGLTNTDPATPTKPKVVGIAQSKVASIAKALVLGLTTRPTTRTTDPTSTATQMVRNSRANRIDEIGEIGAYMLNAIKGLPVFQVDSTANRKAAPSLVIGLLKTIISTSAKVFSDAQFALNGGNVKKAIVKDAVFQADVADDAAGSIGLTLFSINQMGMINPQIYNAIVAKLQTSSTSIAGKTNGPIVLAALNAGLTNGSNGAFQASVIYEDGTIAANALETINNPETDNRSR